MATKNNSKSAKINRRSNYIIATILVLLLAIPVGYVIYQNHLDKQEAARFTQLQSDFKKLQIEFNKIDPGWEYSEGCRSPHFVFSSTEESDCTVALKLKKGTTLVDHVDRYMVTIKASPKTYSENTFESISGLNNVQGLRFEIEGFNDSEGGCLLTINTNNEPSGSVSCGYKSRHSHF